MEKTTYTYNVYEKNSDGTFVKTGTDSYTFWAEGDWMFVEHDGKIQSKKIVDSSEFVYKLLKTKILARDGAKGLCDWMKKCIANNFELNFVEIILFWIAFGKR